MMNKLTSFFALVFALCLFLFSSAALAQSVAPTPTPTAVETLQKGSKGEDVLKMKRRLRELGYFRTDDLNDVFNDATVKALQKFQTKNGIPADGVFTPEVRALLYSDVAEPAVTPTPSPTPSPTPKPLPTPKPTPEVEWPERDEEGYLSGEGEFWYENDDEGFYAYLSPSLQITIAKQEDTTVPLEWFETDIHMRGDETFLTAEVDPAHPGTRFKQPYVIAADAHHVLSFSDDFYGDRIDRKITVGIVIRDGNVISSKTYREQSHHLPNLDLMAVLPDGSLKVYAANEITADELLEMGVRNTFCFGPELIRNGEISSLLKWYDTKSPRQALGMIEPGHYFLLSVMGRMKSSEGCNLTFMAQLMQDRGVVEALNLDGGNTMALVFRGRMLNKLASWKNEKYVRNVTSMIGIGTSDSVTTGQKNEN